MFLVIKLINDNKRLKLHAATCLKVAVLNYYKLLFMKEHDYSFINSYDLKVCSLLGNVYFYLGVIKVSVFCSTLYLVLNKSLIC